ncbi:SEC-C domain-containing protein [Burkholderia seminalis]|uniref:SEC-C domain-containing protein n=1 Tax=Burkholderia seminalis TaxID=488731 RepID=UPI001903F658|nr:SEC-C domain-containing protein [Burkholderia seminalis]MBJ9591978.1 SEC-C domain-containing protein [Burkholderia seminalis]
MTRKKRKRSGHTQGLDSILTTSRADPAAAAEASRLRMEELAERIKVNVLSNDPKQLLGYLWSQLLLATTKTAPQGGGDPPRLETIQMALEYVHAVLSCFPAEGDVPLRLEECRASELVSLIEEMLRQSLLYGVASTAHRDDGEFGPETGRVEMFAKSSWVTLRGHRYQVLEEEFFRYVLAPHDDALRKAYGIRADDIAAGIQQIALSMMLGHGNAYQIMAEGARKFAELAERGIPAHQIRETLMQEDPDLVERGRAALSDMFDGGICNLSRKTTLPEALLSDLAFERGGNDEFFAPGDFRGTPYRTFPGRVRPTVRLDDGYYATDTAFIRDSTYRAIQWGLRSRLPGYRQTWNENQKRMSEDAFEQICTGQLRGARVFKEVFYQNPATGLWVENDVLVLVDDVLVQIEAKAGAMPMHNPATGFTSHIRAVKQLVMEAYDQTKRFFEYASSAPEVPLFRRHDGRYEEVVRLRLADYRACIPAGLTVESFSPFSAMCKELPDIEPILGRYPFVSLSIDDLFVLVKILPGSGMFFHYLTVRQQAAGIRKTMVYDELDHLGFYINKNRFDVELRELKDQGDEVLTTGQSSVIDKYFADNEWADRPRPRQDAPESFWSLCDALDAARKPGWLAAQSYLLDLDGDWRALIASRVDEYSASLAAHPERWIMFKAGGEPVVLWLLREGTELDEDRLANEAEAFALMQGAAARVIVLTYNAQQAIVDAYLRVIAVPAVNTPRYTDAEARAVEQRRRAQELHPPVLRPARPPGRNKPCWCGSGIKYKRCHLEADVASG